MLMIRKISLVMMDYPIFQRTVKAAFAYVSGFDSRRAGKPDFGFRRKSEREEKEE